MKINELQEGKVVVRGLITKCDEGKTAKGNPYLSMILEDDTGSLDTKYWNLQPEQARMFSCGQVVEAVGDLIMYKNAPQLKVRTLEILENEKVADYVRGPSRPIEEMKQEVQDILSKYENPILESVTRRLLEERWDDFFSYPAAVRNHHNFPGGLAAHTLSMAQLAQIVCDHYDFLDRDLLMSGVLLHDLAKIEEYTKPVLPEYSARGNLLGHISMISAMIDEAAGVDQTQDYEEITLLRHMVLSHHGKMEYGSPVLPMIPEAEVLSMLDNLDARMFMMNEQISSLTPGTFGPRNYALDGRMLYRRKGDEDEELQDEEDQDA